MYQSHIELITKEYIVWLQQFGNGRNKQDLRFGQHICNLLNIHDSKVFNQEDAVTAYSMIMENV